MAATDRLAGRKTLAVDGFLAEFDKDEVKARVDITQLFAAFGVTLTAKGRGFTAKCPWHDDAEPSLSVDREKGLYHCFGCGESGDVVSLVQKMKGVGFKEALAYLKTHGATAVLEAKPASSSPAANAVAELNFILDEVATRYASALGAHPEARAYLSSRGLDQAQLIASFKLGYCAGDLAGSLSAAQKAALTKLGVLKASGGEHFAHCVTVPLFDESDHVVGFYGRRIHSNSAPDHLYLPGPHKGLVNRKAAGVYREELILTESVLDALSLVALGIHNVIPCYGAGGLTAEHAKLLKDQRVKQVVIGFDADEAGRRGAEELKGKLLTEGVAVKLAAPPKGKDWNEYLTAGGTAQEIKAMFAVAAAASGSSPEHPMSVATEGERKLFTLGEIRYRVSGARDVFVASLRVNIKAESQAKRYIDNVDLYSARSRTAFAANLAALLSAEPSRIERDLVSILEHLEAERDRRLSTAEAPAFTMSEEDKELGLAFLKDPDLVERVLSDLDALGYVGEEENKLLVYLAATSRRMEDPLSVLIVSESASGKSFLIDCVKRLMPPEEVVAMTSLSDQALQYLAEDALLHKFLVMGEAVHSEIVEHQVREMLSSRELSRLVTLKDEKTGELSSRMVRKPVVVSCALSTTNPQVNPENASRFFVVGADESQEQTKAIFTRQRGKYSVERYRDGDRATAQITHRHHAAQRLLSPRLIVNPFAECLEFPSKLMRARRDHERFLDLIASVCFLRQHLKQEKQREGVHYIECDLTDYRAAYRVMSRVIACTYSALPQAVTGLYEALRLVCKKKATEQKVAADEVSVSQRELREATGVVAHTVKRSLRLLVDWEYLAVEGSRRRGSRICYRLVRDEAAAELSEGSIPSPEEVAVKLQSLQSGTTGTDWDKSGTVPLLGT